MNKQYKISNTLTDAQFEQLYLLTRKMWWSAHRTKDDMRVYLNNCLSFALIETSSQKLVGYARVLTDTLHSAYIYDVMIEETLQKSGLGKMLMEAIIAQKALARVVHFELTCLPEMTSYYEQFGFSNDLPRDFQTNLI